MTRAQQAVRKYHASPKSLLENDENGGEKAMTKTTADQVQDTKAREEISTKT